MVRAGEVLSANALTVNERVMLHLRESTREPEAAFLATQPGIAEALGIRVNHVSRAVKHLVRQRLLAEGTTRVRGEVRKRKAYVITEEGRALALQLVTEVADRRVVAVDASGTRTMAASEARYLVVPPTLTRLLAAMDAEGRLELGSPVPSIARVAPNFDDDRPAPVRLAGREAAVEMVRTWIEQGPPLLAVIGPRGIGKSALLSSCLENTGPRFWWTVRPSDSPASLLRGLATFLAGLGRRDLRARVAKGPLEARETAKILTRDLRDSRAILVLDDIDAASPDTAPYLGDLLSAAAAARCRLAVTSRAPLALGRSLRAEGAMQELFLEGLDRAAARAIVPRADKEEFEKAYRLTGGIPLPLKLAVSESTPRGFTPEERALLKILKVREDED